MEIKRAAWKERARWLNQQEVFGKVGNLYTALYTQEQHRVPHVYPIKLKDEIEYEIIRMTKVFRPPLVKAYDLNQD